MNYESKAVDGTPISDKGLTMLHTAPEMSSILADSPRFGEPFAHFFASTSAYGAPGEYVWLSEKDATALWTTSLLEDHAYEGFLQWHSEPELQQPEPVTKVNTDRVRLLARKYVTKDKFSDEESARLAILTERIRRLLPAVTENEYEALAQDLEASRDISELNSKLRAQLAAKQRGDR